MLPMIWNMVSLLTVMHTFVQSYNSSSSDDGDGDGDDDDDDDDDGYLERITRTGPKRLYILHVRLLFYPLMCSFQLGDLIPFLVILFVFVLAYAVASEALLHPGTSWSALYLLYLPRVGFWPIFGEYGMDTIDGE